MITEDYVSFEVAKLLKEKGFDEICNYEYGVPNIDKGYVLQRWIITNGQIKNSDLIDEAYTAPTLQMAMKWLRETYDIHVVPRKDFFNGTYTGMIYDGRRENVFDKDYYIALVGHETYEQACEASIKYCLIHLI